MHGMFCMRLSFNVYVTKLILTFQANRIYFGHELISLLGLMWTEKLLFIEQDNTMYF